MKPVNGAFVFPVSAFADGKAKHFEYKVSPSQSVRFFIVKSTDGRDPGCSGCVRKVFSRSEGIRSARKRHDLHQLRTEIQNDKVNEVTGGCNPHPLARTIQDDKLIISQQEVASGVRFFPVGGMR